MLQHRLAYWLLHFNRADGKRRKVTDVAERLGLPYHRLQKLVTGQVVMQLEDIGHIRVVMGEIVDLWLLDGANAEIARSVISARMRNR